MLKNDDWYAAAQRRQRDDARAIHESALRERFGVEPVPAADRLADLLKRHGIEQD